MTKTQKTPKKRLKESEGEDFFLYNTDQDTREIIEVLSLDNQRTKQYDSDDYNELY